VVFFFRYALRSRAEIIDAATELMAEGMGYSEAKQLSMYEQARVWKRLNIIGKRRVDAVEAERRRFG